MIVSEKEALHNLYNCEQQYEWGQLTRDTFKTKLEYFLGVLSGYNYDRAESECKRLNQKYGFDLEFEDD